MVNLFKVIKSLLLCYVEKQPEIQWGDGPQQAHWERRMLQVADPQGRDQTPQQPMSKTTNISSSGFRAGLDLNFQPKPFFAFTSWPWIRLQLLASLESG